MTTKNWRKTALLNLVIALLILSPFLPGPPNKLVHLIYNSAQMAGLLGLFVIPIGLIWTIKEFKRKHNNNEYQVGIKAILLLTIPLNIFLTSIYVAWGLRNFSRYLAITRAENLVQSIEQYKDRKGQYPASFADLTPEFIDEIPSPFIMGIQEYEYEKIGSTYNIWFTQNVILNFNFEVVTFDPTDNHKSEGELTKIYETGKSHWKYYVYD